VKESPL